MKPVDPTWDGVDRGVAPEKLSGAFFADPGAGSFDYAKAVQDAIIEDNRRAVEKKKRIAMITGITPEKFWGQDPNRLRRAEAQQDPAAVGERPLAVGDRVRWTNEHDPWWHKADPRWFEGVVETVYDCGFADGTGGVSVRVTDGSASYRPGDRVAYCNPANLVRVPPKPPTVEQVSAASECPVCGEPSGPRVALYGCACIRDRAIAVNIPPLPAVRSAPTVETPWMRADSPCDPLEVKWGGITLRELLEVDHRMQCEDGRGGIAVGPMWLQIQGGLTPAQRAAISAHWSAELRAKVAASAQLDRLQVVMGVDAEDLPW